jgi:hypothetical protein
VRALRGFLRRPGANVGEPRRSQAWRQLVDRVLVELNTLDPYGLEPGAEDGAPRDEYELEAVPMVRELILAGAITGDRVDAIWTTWFGETLSGRTDPARFEAFVARLNAVSPWRDEGS